ncbi:retrovirus polyprotein [Ceratocystis lukuohia]|uniref:RNA-directed DNA polymerase n=1 Tax=Ceratocystis lukuohia TaxID=2019550 RepID=A0ABR4MEV5_9PEZI
MDCSLLLVEVLINDMNMTTALIDPGSSAYNVVSDSFAKQAQLKRIPIPARTMKGAMGSRGVIKEVAHMSINIEGHEEKEVFAYIVPGNDHDVTLGLPWIKKQGAIYIPQEDRMIICSSNTVVEKLGVREERLKKKNNGKTKMSVVNGQAFAAMMRIAKRKGNNTTKIFTASIEDINKALKKKPETSPAELRERLPTQYADLWDAFAHSNEELPPHRPRLDAKIDLQGEKELPWSPLYQMSRDELLVLRKTLTELIEKGFIRPSNSAGGAPVLFVKKPGGGLRLCVDYRALNTILKKDRYPIPLIQETLRVISQAKWLTKLDVRAAFHRVRIAEGDEWKTAFRTRYGSYEWLVMPFGIANGTSVFQRFINHVLDEFLDSCASAYIDDVIVYSDGSLEDHRQKVRSVLQKLQQAGLRLDLDKCEFEVQKVKYLGVIITAGKGVEMDPEKVAAIQDWQQPTTAKGVRGFLGFTNYHRDFIKDYAELTAPLVALTKKDTPFKWGEAEETAFTKLKDAFVKGDMLASWDPEAQTWLETDASGVGIGAVLNQGPEAAKRPIAFFSRKMTPTEMNYGIHDKELLAVIEAVRKWRGELRGLEKFTLLTDHKNLQYFRTKQLLSERQIRWMEELESLPTFTTIHRPGKLAVVPDALSRKDEFFDKEERDESRTKRLWKESWDPVETQHTEIMQQSITEESTSTGVETRNPFETDSNLGELWRTAINKDSNYEKIAEHIEQRTQFPSTLVPPGSAQASDCSVRDGIVYHRHAIWTPDCEELKGELLKRHHVDPISGHGGRDATIVALRRQFFWPKMIEDVKRLLRNCDWCGRTKPWREKIHGLLTPLPVPSRPWQGISMDFMTHLPGKFTDLLVVTCRLTGNVILVPLEDTKTMTVVDAVLANVYAHHGPPEWIVSDRGPQWVGELWKTFCETLGVERRLSTAYHPQTDGATERANQEVQIFLRTRIAMDQQDWAKWIPAAQIALNNRPQPRRHGVSPFFLTHGYNIAPVQICEEVSTSAEGSKIADVEAIKTKLGELTEWAQVVTADTQQNMERQANKHRTAAPMFQPGQEVWLKLKNMKLGRPNRKLDWLNAKYKVIKQVAPMVYELDVPRGIHPTFHTDLLRPAGEDPWPGQNADSDKTTPLFNEKGEEVWLVDDILCAFGKRKERVVWIKWKGFETPTCEPIDNVIEDNLEALHSWEVKWGPITKNDGPKETYLTPTGRLKSKWKKKEGEEKENDIAV